MSDHVSQTTDDLTDEELADEDSLSLDWCLQQHDEYYWKVGLKNAMREIDRLRARIEEMDDKWQDVDHD